MRSCNPAASLLGAFGVLLIAAGATEAAAQVKGGRWEFTVRVDGPGIPQVPAFQLPPGMQAAPRGMTATRTECVTESGPIPPALAGSGAMSAQGDGQFDCRVDRLDRSGATVRWATTCTTAESSIHSEGVAHYRGVTMTADVTVTAMSAAGPGPAMLQHLAGHYLGPCVP